MLLPPISIDLELVVENFVSYLFATFRLYCNNYFSLFHLDADQKNVFDFKRMTNIATDQ
jgi:hypothetical protein